MNFDPCPISVAALVRNLVDKIKSICTCCHLSLQCLSHTVMHEAYLPLCRGLRARIAGKAQGLHTTMTDQMQCNIQIFLANYILHNSYWE